METAKAVASLASHGVPMTMDGWRDMTIRDQQALIHVVNEAERAARRRARR